MRSGSRHSSAGRLQTNTKAGTRFCDFGTNAVVPVSMGVPTIGFGPGDDALAHMVNERCRLSEVTDACRLYAKLIEKL